MDFLIKFVVTGIALFITTQVVPRLDLDLSGDLWKPALVVVVFAVVNAYLRPIVKLLSLPLSLMTMGLIGFVINLALFMLVGFVSGELDLGFRIAGWPGGPLDAEVVITALLGSIVMGIVATLVNLALSSRRLIGM